VARSGPDCTKGGVYFVVAVHKRSHNVNDQRRYTTHRFGHWGEWADFGLFLQFSGRNGMRSIVHASGAEIPTSRANSRSRRPMIMPCFSCTLNQLEVPGLLYCTLPVYPARATDSASVMIGTTGQPTSRDDIQTSIGQTAASRPVGVRYTSRTFSWRAGRRTRGGICCTLERVHKKHTDTARAFVRAIRQRCRLLLGITR
jgi:hypothetical protein